jgi:hypothetical protein
MCKKEEFMKNIEEVKKKIEDETIELELYIAGADNDYNNKENQRKMLKMYKKICIEKEICL